MNDYLTMLWGLLQTKLVVLFLLTALDFVFGVIVSLVKKDFKWEYLMHYVNTDVLPILAWVGVVLLSTIPATAIPGGVVIPVVPDVIYGTVFLSILASVIGAFTAIEALKEPLEKIGIGKPEL